MLSKVAEEIISDQLNGQRERMMVPLDELPFTESCPTTLSPAHFEYNMQHSGLDETSYSANGEEITALQNDGSSVEAGGFIRDSLPNQDPVFRESSSVIPVEEVESIRFEALPSDEDSPESAMSALVCDKTFLQMVNSDDENLNPSTIDSLVNKVSEEDVSSQRDQMTVRNEESSCIETLETNPLPVRSEAAHPMGNNSHDAELDGASDLRNGEAISPLLNNKTSSEAGDLVRHSSPGQIPDDSSPRMTSRDNIAKLICGSYIPRKRFPRLNENNFASPYLRRRLRMKIEHRKHNVMIDGQMKVGWRGTRQLFDRTVPLRCPRCRLSFEELVEDEDDLSNEQSSNVAKDRKRIVKQKLICRRSHVDRRCREDTFQRQQMYSHNVNCSFRGEECARRYNDIVVDGHGLGQFLSRDTRFVMIALTLIIMLYFLYDFVFRHYLDTVFLP
ncbi:unnamed protein product [Soboliphyme baturini]|uniref:Uncharacterized protein n=1 Tax=Soboliphyme baturini TaxID=241478 RepID=A0A183IYK1_9BILA|nr:unnamed protein product [Soboliphyme baturini]